MQKGLKNLEIPKVEQIPATEKSSENLDFSQNIEIPKTLEKNEKPTDSQTVQSAQVISQPVLDESEIQLTKDIENILERDLKDLYMNMPRQKQVEFKKKGEEVASKISTLIKETKIQVKKIINLIIEWLGIIPGVNRIFIKQEAKIKTDKIIALKNKK